MVRIDRVVTRGGDNGETSLGDGQRVAEADRVHSSVGRHEMERRSKVGLRAG